MVTDCIFHIIHRAFLIFALTPVFFAELASTKFLNFNFHLQTSFSVFTEVLFEAIKLFPSELHLFHIYKSVYQSVLLFENKGGYSADIREQQFVSMQQ